MWLKTITLIISQCPWIGSQGLAYLGSLALGLSEAQLEKMHFLTHLCGYWQNSVPHVLLVRNFHRFLAA